MAIGFKIKEVYAKRRSGIDLSSECDPIEIEAPRTAIKIALSNGDAPELGTAAGDTLKELINFFKSAGKNYRFHVIDPMTYYPNQLEKVQDNVKSIIHALKLL